MVQSKKSSKGESETGTFQNISLPTYTNGNPTSINNNNNYTNIYKSNNNKQNNSSNQFEILEI